jgi:hypothetical protein
MARSTLPTRPSITNLAREFDLVELLEGLPVVRVDNLAKVIGAEISPSTVAALSGAHDLIQIRVSHPMPVAACLMAAALRGLIENSELSRRLGAQARIRFHDKDAWQRAPGRVVNALDRLPAFPVPERTWA